MSLGTEGTPMGSTDGNTQSVGFDDIEEKELAVPAGELTESVLIEADPENDGIIYVMLSEDVGKSGGLILEPGSIVSMTINTSANPVYLMANTVDDSARVAWLK